MRCWKLCCAAVRLYRLVCEFASDGSDYTWTADKKGGPGVWPEHITHARLTLPGTLQLAIITQDVTCLGRVSGWSMHNSVYVITGCEYV
jgi:hypothetical protein